VCGDEDFATLVALKAVAYTLADGGDDAAALPLFTELVATSRRVKAKGLPAEVGTLTALMGLAAAHGRLGKYHLALPLYQEAVDGHRRALGAGHATTLLSMIGLCNILSNLQEYKRSLPLKKQIVEGQRKLLGPQHPDTLLQVGELATLHAAMGDHEAAAPLLQQQLDGFTALSVAGSGRRYRQEVANARVARDHNARCLEEPKEAAAVQRQMRQLKLELEASLPTAAATVAGVQGRPELNGAQVTIRRFLVDKGRYAVLLPPDDADGKRKQINLKPANLELVEGTAVVLTGLTGDQAASNGQRGTMASAVINGQRVWLVRLEVALGGTPVVGFQPEHWRADVLAL